MTAESPTEITLKIRFANTSSAKNTLFFARVKHPYARGNNNSNQILFFFNTFKAPSSFVNSTLILPYYCVRLVSKTNFLPFSFFDKYAKIVARDNTSDKVSLERSAYFIRSRITKKLYVPVPLQKKDRKEFSYEPFCNTY